MTNAPTEFSYGKWDEPEDEEIAFYNVANKIWDIKRFSAWVSHVRVVEYRNANAHEGS